jgi:para-nitrobenzyl esterase
MKAYWTNFAKNGNPNGPGLPAWPVYKKENDRHMELGAEIRTGQGLYREACDIFEQLLYERITKK